MLGLLYELHSGDQPSKVAQGNLSVMLLITSTHTHKYVGSARTVCLHRVFDEIAPMRRFWGSHPTSQCARDSDSTLNNQCAHDSESWMTTSKPTHRCDFEKYSAYTFGSGRPYIFVSVLVNKSMTLRLPCATLLGWSPECSTQSKPSMCTIATMHNTQAHMCTIATVLRGRMWCLILTKKGT